MLSKKKHNRIVYRSDWPEVGLPAPTQTITSADSNSSSPKELQSWRAADTGRHYRWVVNKDSFESELYNFPVYNFHLEILWDDTPNDLPVVWNSEKRAVVKQAVLELMQKPPWQEGYALCKTVKEEPLFSALAAVGFEEIEQRSIYRCPLSSIHGPLSTSPVPIQYRSFAGLQPMALEKYKRSLLEVCRLSFMASGLSRHFSDPYLLKQKAGIDYILAVMNLNFSQCSAENIFIALDTTVDQVCGFTIVGKKAGLSSTTYSQLLSAVHPEYRGCGIYHRLTELLIKTLPQDALLLNVTHTANKTIQRAYKKSKRSFLTDNSIVRRFF